MNLHEECLLRYLQAPQELAVSTDFLKINNQALEKAFVLDNVFNNLQFGYNE